jgi:hypothetical protein
MKIGISQTTIMMVTAICVMSPSMDDAYGGSKTMREKLKSTIGGAEYVVTGEVIDVKDNMYTLRSSGGETIQLEASDDTNMFCDSRSGGSQGQRTSTSSQPSSGTGMGQSSQTESSIGVSEKQSQSQESHAGQKTKGFRIGDCPFQKGDFVKAELTDMGTVTFMRSVDKIPSQTARAGQGREGDESKGSGRSTEEMGLPQEYIFLPAGALGSLSVKDTEQYSVKTSDGEDVGYVYKVILNNQGDPAYVIIREKETQQLKPLPWQAVQVSPETQTVTLVVSRSQIDQMPGYSASDISMNSIRGYWELAREEKDRRVSRQQARGQERFHEGPYEGARSGEDYSRYPDYPQLGSRPGEAGEPGETSIFGSPSTLPPGEHAPQYTGADKQRYQGDDFRHRRGGGQYDPQQRRYFDRDRQTRYSDEFRDEGDRGRYDRQQSFDRDRQSRYSDDFRSQGDRGQYDRQQSQNRDRQSRYSDDFRNQGDSGPSIYSRSQERNDGYDRFQSRRSRTSDYEDRPEPYRP